jgi:hypothetical protein
MPTKGAQGSIKDDKLVGTRLIVGAQGSVVDWLVQGSQSGHKALRTNKQVYDSSK